MVALEYVDLIGMPYKLHGRSPAGFDCSTICEEVLRRLGYDPPATSPFRYVGSKGELGEFEEYMAKAQEALTCIGTDLSLATQVGDLLLTSAQSCSVTRGMYALVDKGLFLTSLPKSGVTPVTRETLLRMQPPILGVYRYNAVL